MGRKRKQEDILLDVGRLNRIQWLADTVYDIFRRETASYSDEDEEDARLALASLIAADSNSFMLAPKRRKRK